MQNESITAYLKRIIRQSGLVGKLIFINLVVFLFILLIRLIGHLFVDDALFGNVLSYLIASSVPSEIIFRPWTIVTYQFTHFELMHLLLNMLVLFFTARIFVHFFGERRLLSTYVLGGVFGYLIHSAAYFVFPLLKADGPSVILGASASVMAVFFAAAVHQPSFQVKLFGVFSMPLIAIAGIFLLSDLMGVGSSGGGVAHFAHLGGALFGAISVIKAHSVGNIMNRVDRIIARIKLPKITFKREPKLRVHTGESATSKMSDEDYNAARNKRQERVDAILEKISKKGYEGLTKEEKDILFKESKR